MKISAIDQGHFRGSALQFLRGVESAESSAKYDDPVSRGHALPSFPGNFVLPRIISFCVRSFPTYWIRGGRVSVPKFLGAGMAIALLFPMFSARANEPDTSAISSPNVTPSAATDASDSHAGSSTGASSPASEPVRWGGDPGPIVIGFLGGYVRHDDAVHTTVQVAKSLRETYPTAIHVATFENRRSDDAHTLIVNLLGAKSASALTAEQKRSAHIILYGHSWGACAVVALARQLKTEGIPVVLTVQVDSVSKAGRDDQTIPDNVRYAANFYQDKGIIRGQPKIVAADTSRTTILGNFFFDYSAHPIACPEYPWYTRFFMRSHIEIECDQKVWQRVENLIREKLPTAVGGASAVPLNNDTASNIQPVADVNAASRQEQ
jgi:hypothetical protein